jgi:hypothetical protein
MKVLVLNYVPFAHPLGGGTKADRFIVGHLAASGCCCHVIIPSSHSAYESSTKAAPAGAPVTLVETFQDLGAQIDVVHERTSSDFHRSAGLVHHITEVISKEIPNWIFVTGSDRGHRMLKAAVQTSESRNVVYIPRCTLDLPFGPFAIFPDSAATSALVDTHRIFCPSRYMAQYIRTWSGLHAQPLDLPVYSSPALPRPMHDPPFITHINPCDIKGIDILCALALKHPAWQFAAVPGWGTTRVDMCRIQSIPNIHLLTPSVNVDVIYSQTRILLMPSLWDEAFGMVSVEAMQRRIPVIASAVGGLPEAKLGVDFLIPVNAIQTYTGLHPDSCTPLAVVPPQDFDGWSSALSMLMGHPQEYEQLALESEEAAVRYVTGLRTDALDAILGETPACKLAPTYPIHTSDTADRIAGLSAEQRKVLIERMRARDQPPRRGS